MGQLLYLLIYLDVHLNDAGEVDGGALLYVPLLRPHDDGLGLDDPQVHAVLEVRRGADLVAALGQAECPLHLHPPGSCTTPGPASPQASAPASTQRSRGCVAPAVGSVLKC